MRDRLLIQSLLTTAWALHEPVLRSLAQVIGRHAVGGTLTSAQIQQVVIEGQEQPARVARRASAANRSSEGGAGYSICDGIAVIPITGVLAKRSSQVNDVSQPEGTACESIQMSLYHALGNQMVRGVLLDIDSPGGSIDGIADLATVIFEASNGDVPIVAHCNEMCCSAAYWLACQCNAVYLSETAIAGSIGVYTVLHDVSKWFTEELLTKVHLVKAGDRKGDGVPGTEISPEAIAAVQADIQACYDVFTKHVARGLVISRADAKSLADGSTWVGAQAVEAGIADGVQSFDETLSDMIAESRPLDGNVIGVRPSPPRSSKEGADMAISKRRGKAAINNSRPTGRRASEEDEDDTSAEDETDDTCAEDEEDKPAAKGKKGAKGKKSKAEEPEDDEPQAADEDGDGVDDDEEKDDTSASAIATERARCKAINAAFPNHPKFAAQAIDKGWTVAQAKAKAFDAGIGAKAAPAASKPGGVKPLQASGKVRRAADEDDDDAGGGYESESGDPVADFNALVAKHAKRNGGNRAKAVTAAAKEDPELHTEYLCALNPGSKRQSLIRERMELIGS